MFSRLLLSYLRRPQFAFLFALVFGKLSALLPVKRVWESQVLLAFHHPAPAYPLHILIVPKKAYRSLQDLPAADEPFWGHLVAAVNEIARAFDLQSQDYRLVVNGGAYQEIPHLHFHLILEAG